MIEQDAEIFVDGKFVGEVPITVNTKTIVLCTPEADYEFTLTKTIAK